MCKTRRVEKIKARDEAVGAVIFHEKCHAKKRKKNQRGKFSRPTEVTGQCILTARTDALTLRRLCLLLSQVSQLLQPTCFLLPNA